MGLDQWIYRMRKCKPAFVERAQGMRYDDLERLFWCDRDDEDPDAPRDGFLVECTDDTQDLERCADRVTLICSSTDENALRLAHDVPLDTVRTSFYSAPNTIRIEYETRNADGKTVQSYEICMTDEDLELFNIDTKCDYWLCDATELKQYRKAYDIQDAIHEHHETVNCGYHDISDDETLDELEAIDETLVIPRLHEDDAIVYHEWH